MREVVNTLLRRDLHLVADEMGPYCQDVYDHVLRAMKWTESLRDLATSILEANLALQGNRLNVITKKVTGLPSSPYRRPSPASTAKTCPTPGLARSEASSVR